MKKTHVRIEVYIIVMAFLAMGGGPKTSGKVERSKLEKVITTEFELTIDIKARVNYFKDF